jgi:hypothetical protein
VGRGNRANFQLGPTSSYAYSGLVIRSFYVYRIVLISDGRVLGTLIGDRSPTGHPPPLGFRENFHQRRKLVEFSAAGADLESDTDDSKKHINQYAPSFAAAQGRCSFD